MTPLERLRAANGGLEFIYALDRIAADLGLPSYPHIYFGPRLRRTFANIYARYQGTPEAANVATMLTAAAAAVMPYV